MYCFSRKIYWNLLVHCTQEPPVPLPWFWVCSLLFSPHYQSHQQTHTHVHTRAHTCGDTPVLTSALCTNTQAISAVGWSGDTSDRCVCLLNVVWQVTIHNITLLFFGFFLRKILHLLMPPDLQRKQESNTQDPANREG